MAAELTDRQLEAMQARRSQLLQDEWDTALKMAMTQRVSDTSKICSQARFLAAKCLAMSRLQGREDPREACSKSLIRFNECNAKLWSTVDRQCRPPARDLFNCLDKLKSTHVMNCPKELVALDQCTESFQPNPEYA